MSRGIMYPRSMLVGVSFLTGSIRITSVLKYYGQLYANQLVSKLTEQPLETAELQWLQDLCVLVVIGDCVRVLYGKVSFWLSAMRPCHFSLTQISPLGSRSPSLGIAIISE